MRACRCGGANVFAGFASAGCCGRVHAVACVFRAAGICRREANVSRRLRSPMGADVFDLRRALPGRIGYCRRRNCGAGRTRKRGGRANTCGAHPPEPYPHRIVGRRGVSEDSVPESRPAETRWMTGARAMGAAWFGGVTGAFGLCGREPSCPRRRPPRTVRVLCGDKLSVALFLPSVRPHSGVRAGKRTLPCTGRECSKFVDRIFR